MACFTSVVQSRMCLTEEFRSNKKSQSVRRVLHSSILNVSLHLLWVFIVPSLSFKRCFSFEKNLWILQRTEKNVVVLLHHFSSDQNVTGAPARVLSKWSSLDYIDRKKLYPARGWHWLIPRHIIGQQRIVFQKQRSNLLCQNPQFELYMYQCFQYFYARDKNSLTWAKTKSAKLKFRQETLAFCYLCQNKMFCPV